MKDDERVKSLLAFPGFSLRTGPRRPLLVIRWRLLDHAGVSGAMSGVWDDNDVGGSRRGARWSGPRLGMRT